MKKKPAKTTILPRLCTELIKVPRSILIEEIELISLKGLSSLKALRADNELPPDPLIRVKI
jgi:hypothetical protein